MYNQSLLLLPRQSKNQTPTLRRKTSGLQSKNSTPSCISRSKSNPRLWRLREGDSWRSNWIPRKLPNSRRKKPSKKRINSMISHRKLIWNCSRRENRKRIELFQRSCFKKRYPEMPNWKRWSTSAERKPESDSKKKYSALTCSKMKWSRNVWSRMKRKDKRKNTFLRCFSKMKRTWSSRSNLRRKNGKKISEPRKHTPGCWTSKSKTGWMRLQPGRRERRISWTGWLMGSLRS